MIHAFCDGMVAGICEEGGEKGACSVRLSIVMPESFPLGPTE